VGCSNVEQDFDRVPPNETAQMYWRGFASADAERYVTALLADPAHALVATFTAPGDPALYARWSARPVTYALLVCYPTTPANVRADYALPNGKRVPKMQRGADAPLLPGTGRHPVLLFSHGYAGSPLTHTYLDALVAFASHGWITVAPFHGDLRYSVFGPGNPASKQYIPVWEEFVAMQATRPLSLAAALDLLGAHAQWRALVDMDRVGAFGISQGGETLMLMSGAELTHTLHFASKPVIADARLKAAVGYVPYFGRNDLPAFGADQAGAASVSVPYLAVSGTDDGVAPLAVVEQAFSHLRYSRGLVALQGQGHDLEPPTGDDVFTWALTFLSAHVLGDADARTRMDAATSVSGGLDDLKIQYADEGRGPALRDTIEFHHAGLDHYFITADAPEAAMLDEGVQVPGWRRTGYVFKTWSPADAVGDEACRFFGTPGVGPSSHFYTIDAAECSLVKTNPAWTYEAIAFRAVSSAFGCTPGQRIVTRVYNNGMGGQANHRYLIDDAEIARMTTLGWVVEGPVFCVPA
jgi:predicted dienelactone hydrolase